MNNVFYKNVMICNYKKIVSCKDKFVPKFVKNNIVLTPSDPSK